MELYGRNSGRGRSYSDAQVEWGPPAGLTGLEESMMRLGMRSREAYPERPGVSDCVYYMRTGFCGYGTRCRYNHPRDRSGVAVAVRSGTVEYPERVGEPSCQFYLKTGTCKFGASCKFHHPKGGGSMNQVPLNFCGFPLRPGEKECSYYLKTGQCKFGVSCKFHHPQSASASTFYPAMQTPSIPPEQYGGTSASWRVARPPLLPGSYVQGPYGPLLVSPGVVPIPGWNPYSASVSPVMSPGAQPTVGAGSLYGITQLSLSSPALPGQYNLLSSSSGGGPSGSRWREQMFPERPGEPECQYYLKTGDCKFGSSCRYHHPREWIVPNTNCVLSQIGLPLRPGVQPCAFYLKQGHCKFGSSCKFDHPLIAMKYTPSASSCIDFAITSYPTGPSFLSSDLRPEFMPGSRKETLSTRALPFRGGSSSSPASLILSQTASLPLSEVQFSGQSPPPQLSSSSRSGRQGSEVHCSS